MKRVSRIKPPSKVEHTSSQVSSRSPAAVDGHGGPIDERCLVRREVPHHRSHFLRPAQASHGLPCPQLRANLFLVVLVELLQVSLDERRLHSARADRIYAQ